MGERAAVHVILDIVPRRIDAAAWAAAFEETVRLVEAHPARLLGYGFRVAGGGARARVHPRRRPGRGGPGGGGG